MTPYIWPHFLSFSVCIGTRQLELEKKVFRKKREVSEELTDLTNQVEGIGYVKINSAEVPEQPVSQGSLATKPIYLPET
ncbi:MAG: hypothetical protein ACI9S8_000763 [Chlamydiales bacterium]|jgi:hypothetical protein